MARSTYVLVAVALATAPFVLAADRTANAVPATERAVAVAATSQVEIALPSPALTLKALFAATAQEEVIEAVDGVAAGIGAMEVLVARIDTDGRVVSACVDSEKSARAFLGAPIEKVATKRAKEQ